MPYKDKDKQKAANRLAAQKRRDKGITIVKAKGMTNQGITVTSHGAAFKPKPSTARPMNWGLIDCQCQHCQTARVNNSKNTINHGAWKSYADLADNEVNRVTLPGDVDYSTSSTSVGVFK